MTREYTSRRRNVMKAMGGLMAGGALAGCTGQSDGSGGDGGDGADGGQTTPMATEAPPEYHAVFAIVEAELNQMPSIAALRELLPAASDDRLTGEVRTFESATLPLQALIQGAVDYYALSPGNVFQAQLAGNDPRILCTRLKGTDYLFVVNTNNADVDTVNELFQGDYEIGIAGLGGLSHMQVAGVIEREGFDPQSPEMEEKVVSVGGSGTRTSAVAAGQIDATIVHIDQYDRIRNEGAPVRRIGALTDYFPNFVAQTFTVRGEDVEKYDEGAHFEEYINQAVKAHKRASEDFEWVLGMTEKYSAHPLDEEDARESWEFNAEVLETWPYREGDYQKSDYQDSIDILKAGGVLTDEQADQIDLDRLLDFELFENALDNLG